MELRRADEAGHCRRRLPAASVTVTHLTQQPAMLGRFRGAPAGFAVLAGALPVLYCRTDTVLASTTVQVVVVLASSHSLNHSHSHVTLPLLALVLSQCHSTISGTSTSTGTSSCSWYSTVLVLVLPVVVVLGP
jgi:hypothetical protein